MIACSIPLKCILFSYRSYASHHRAEAVLNMNMNSQYALEATEAWLSEPSPEVAGSGRLGTTLAIAGKNTDN